MKKYICIAVNSICKEGSYTNLDATMSISKRVTSADSGFIPKGVDYLIPEHARRIKIIFDNELNNVINIIDGIVDISPLLYLYAYQSSHQICPIIADAIKYALTAKYKYLTVLESPEPNSNIYQVNIKDYDCHIKLVDDKLNFILIEMEEECVNKRDDI